MITFLIYFILYLYILYIYIYLYKSNRFAIVSFHYQGNLSMASDVPGSHLMYLISGFHGETLSCPQITNEGIRSITAILVGIYIFLIIIKSLSLLPQAFIHTSGSRALHHQPAEVQNYFSVIKSISKCVKQTLGIMTWDKIMKLFNFSTSAL